MYRSTFYAQRNTMTSAQWARLRFRNVWLARIDRIGQRIAPQVIIGFSMMIVGIVIGILTGNVIL